MIIVLLSKASSCSRWFILGLHTALWLKKPSGSLESESVWSSAAFVSHHLFSISLYLSQKLTKCSLSGLSRLSVLAEHVIPGWVPVINKLVQLYTASIKPVFMLPYFSAKCLFGYLIHDRFENVPLFFYSTCWNFS